MSYTQLLKPKKSLGQNFLIDRNIARKIIDLLQLDQTDTVIEIGPGLGSLTSILFDCKAKLVAIELDRRVVDYLKLKYPPELIGYEIINDDVRHIGLGSIAASFVKVPGRKLKIVGNIPYNISSDIIFWLIENSSHISRAVLTLQKEVAQRLTAKPKTKQYGITTIAVQFCSKANIAFSIPGDCFRPKPKVDSAVLMLDFIEKPFNADYFRSLMELVRAAFSQRRKILGNALKGYLEKNSVLPLPQLSERLKTMGCNYLSQRAEELSLEDYLILLKILTLEI